MRHFQKFGFLLFNAAIAATPSAASIQPVTANPAIVKPIAAATMAPTQVPAAKTAPKNDPKPAISLVPLDGEAGGKDPEATTNAHAKILISGLALWNTLGDAPRYLLIMGTIDGLNAGQAPIGGCFTGKNNTAINEELLAVGFGSHSVAELPEAMKQVAGKECHDEVSRGYRVSLLQSMPSDHFAVYAAGAIRAYASVAQCPPLNEQYALNAVIEELKKPANKDLAPGVFLGRVLKVACNGPVATEVSPAPTAIKKN